jgi:hypothetical protein
MNTEIIVVSGLPRSGTSVMMQTLHAGGIDAMTDRIRAADTDNPRGYFEFEQVKKIKSDASWLPKARGKVFKMVSQLLYDLPATERYRILFMERNMEEVLDSQEKMLHRLGRTSAPRDEIARAYGLHLTRLFRWLDQQAHMKWLRVHYAELVARPMTVVAGVREFLGGRLEVAAATAAVDPSLYRNRKTGTEPVAGRPG